MDNMVRMTAKSLTASGVVVSLLFGKHKNSPSPSSFPGLYDCLLTATQAAYMATRMQTSPL